ncbi:dienelactone hydrolase family protein [Yinghuangia sp. ASG 101]|uniref:dienelactone hydrolase family protein n=1 Tax=Yinghuangia sp. ASG 101 TaxID=2896848 RepID=UPI001E368C90|nr:alpha/beta fold hydrolase [Yinghuangia sp. ASG 101]UGQ12626.1 dienelactone hydrolase family protein [Yinghuangia sp. ASG 101]
MTRANVTVETPDGTCAATLHTPAPDAAPAPGVIVYPDAVGVRETFSVLADRLAALGYAVLLPDIYYRTPYEPFDAANLFGDLDRLRALAALLTPDMAERDATAYLDFLAARPEVGGERFGTVGYCMGGRIALLAAARNPDRIGAAASIHGGNLAPEGDAGSPASLAGRITAAVHVAVAENDPSFPADQYERLETALTAAGVRHTIETYPGAHGFAVSDNPGYAAAADERHWAALAKLYADALPA